MKKLIPLLILILTMACGSSSGNKEKTAQEELTLADSISQVIENDRIELSTTTQETLSEVDSLLETL